MQYTKRKNKLVRMLESHVYDHQIVEEMREKLATALDSVSANIMKLSERRISAAKFEEVENYTGELELFTEEHVQADRKVQDCLDSVREEVRSRRSKKSGILSIQSSVSARSDAFHRLGFVEERKPFVKQLDKIHGAERRSEQSNCQEEDKAKEKTLRAYENENEVDGDKTKDLLRNHTKAEIEEIKQT